MPRLMRVDIVLGHLDRVTQEVLSYLLLVQNTLQSSFEFRILDCPPEDPLIKLLSAGEVRSDGASFARRVRSFNADRAAEFELEIDEGDVIVLLTDTRLDTNEYLIGERSWAVIALGRWQRELSPPTIIEYYLTAVLAALVEALANNISVHYTTRGCVSDFNGNLSDARFSTVSGYLCDACAEKIKATTSEQAVNDLRTLLKREWLGDPSKPSEIATTAKKLGFDLFRTTGVKQSLRERWLAILEQEGLKNSIAISFQVMLLLITAMLIYVGLPRAPGK